eukprot:TRINITY_DN838_c0_g1_i3.p1 TRINITY_DN838_c0_g1~~TRINITY_DN838_c0_g1_i3.p1  ORF type:complete len:2186 (-),score=829.25 TRINITY_DN838_c0_g1_i3:132-6689(-)
MSRKAEGTEADLRNNRFAYSELASRVTQSDVKRVRVGDNEKGNALSLKEHLGPRSMGDRVRREVPEEPLRKRGKHSKGPSLKSDVVLDDSSLERTYHPKTQQTKLVWEQIVHQLLQASRVLTNDEAVEVAEDILDLAKNKDIDDETRYRKVVEEHVRLSQEQYGNIIRLCGGITDYQTDDVAASSNGIDDIVALGEDSESSDADGLDYYAGSDDEDEDSDIGEDTRNDDQAVAGIALDGIAGAKGDYMIPLEQIDGQWLQRTISDTCEESVSPEERMELSNKVMNILSDALKGDNVQNVDRKLVEILGFEKLSLVQALIKNRHRIVFCTRLSNADSADEERQIKQEMRESDEGIAVMEGLDKNVASASFTGNQQMSNLRDTATQEYLALNPSTEIKDDVMMFGDENIPGQVTSTETYDLETMKFAEGDHTNNNNECELPEGSWRKTEKGIEQVHIPGSKRTFDPEQYPSIPIKQAFPKWARYAFDGMTNLNRMQSKVHPVAFNNSKNLLLCAPTGAGKTNVAMMTMLHEIGKHLDEDSNVKLDEFKIIYVAPMKALVQETVLNFGRRLEKYGITVRELSGDQQLNKSQIDETQVIVTTPEKWDIVTRKSGERTYTQKVKLMIIDEIHLLHNDRGAVLESLVARMMKQVETTREMVRIVGLSATLPNYHDVAKFLRIEGDGLQFFDSSFRPVPLTQTYIGVMEKKYSKRMTLMTKVAYNKVKTTAADNQVLIFVHSRSNTAQTAQSLQQMAVEQNDIGDFIAESSETREVLVEEAGKVENKDLKELMPFGFGIHHAGMTREDRNLVEDLFAAGHLRVLVSTATLAWGVNLPAHTVIILGTEIYSPEKGCMIPLSTLDMQQMLGRAGRPQFDELGEGIIITSHKEMTFYMSLMNNQLPVESQLIGRLCDALNAEVVMGSVQSVKEGADWLSYSFLSQRMAKSPSVYKISDEELDKDPELLQRRVNLIHSAAAVLDKYGLIKYDRKSGNFQVTALGRICSNYYISCASVARYNEFLKPTMTEIDILRLFSMSQEFKNVTVRVGEKPELAKLVEQVPIPVKESIEEPSVKINILLQSYITRLPLTGFDVQADMVYVQQNGGRIMQALFEIALRRGWASVAKRCHDFALMIQHRQWKSAVPLRQFKDKYSLDKTTLNKLENKDVSFERYHYLDSASFGEMVGDRRKGNKIAKLVDMLPRFELAACARPISRDVMKIDLDLQAKFLYDYNVHGGAEPFWIICEDSDGEQVLHSEYFVLKSKHAVAAHRGDEPPVRTVSFIVKMQEPLPPYLAIKVISDRWLHCEQSICVHMRGVFLPDKPLPYTQLLDLDPIPTNAVGEPKFGGIRGFERLFSDFSTFNPPQTQAFSALFDSDDSVFIGAPTGSGKTVCAELAIMRLLAQESTETILYIAPNQDICDIRYKDWSRRFGKILDLVVVKLTGDQGADFKLVQRGQIVIATPPQWDQLSRRWRKRRSIQNVGLVILDELHLVGQGEEGTTYEMIASRTRHMGSQLEKHIRMIGLSSSVANGNDLGDWIGASSKHIFTFHPSCRPVPLEVRIQGFPLNNFSARLLTMAKPCFNVIISHSRTQPTIVFVPSRKQAALTAIDLLSFVTTQEDPGLFLHVDNEMAEEGDFPDSRMADIENPSLRDTVSAGIGFLHGNLCEEDVAIVKQLYSEGVIQILVADHELCWSMDLTCHLCVVYDTMFYDGKAHGYVDYSLADVQQMLGLTVQRESHHGVGVIFCHSPKTAFFKEFLHSALPVESHLQFTLADHFNAEIVSGSIENGQDALDFLTWTLLPRRLMKNANYYGLTGVTPRHLSDHLSELVEQTVSELSENHCVDFDEDESTLSPLNLGMISSFYYVVCKTMRMLNEALVSPKVKLNGLMAILSQAAEFHDLPVRHGDERRLKSILKHLPQKIEDPDYKNPVTKANILLQSHFSRFALPTELKLDQKEVLTTSVRLLQAMVDVIASNGWMKPVLATMELCQMIVQGLWKRDSPLLQIPHFTASIAKRFEKNEVESVFDMIDMEDDSRDKLMKDFNKEQRADIARFCNRFPDVEVEYELQDPESIIAGQPCMLLVNITRSDNDEALDEDTGIGSVHAPLFPGKKSEGWWLVLGKEKKNSLSTIKRTTFGQSTTVKLVFDAPAEPGKHKLDLLLMSDSYLGSDHGPFSIKLNVKEDTGSEEESDEESDE